MFITAPRADGMDRSPYGRFWFEPVGMLSRSRIRVTPASSFALPAVYACVQVLAQSFAIMPFVQYLPKVNGGRTRVRKHWLYRLIAKSPNRFQTPYEWRLMLQGHLALRGNAFCQITANGKGEITDLLPLHPDRMTVELLDNGSYRYRYIDQFGDTVYYQRGELWHLRSLSSDGYMGISPIEASREAIGEGLAMQSYSSRFFANDAQPSGGWIEAPTKFPTKEARGVFREDWQNMQGGANRGKIAVLEGGMKFHEVALNNKDSQYIESRGLKVTEIARIFRIPPHKIQDLSRATFSNVEQLAIEFWQDTMLPWAELWESSIEYFLLGEDTEFEVEFDMSRMMRGDAAARAARISTLVNAGVMTRNEGRDEEGYDPIEGLDEPLRPLNMIEESAAPDEISENDSGADDKAGPANDSGDAEARRVKHREAMRRAKRQEAETQALKDSANVRVAALLQANAERLARRIAAGKPTSAEVLAEAMAVTPERAQVWGDVTDVASLNEEQLTASLVALGKTV